MVFAGLLVVVFLTASCTSGPDNAPSVEKSEDGGEQAAQRTIAGREPVLDVNSEKALREEDGNTPPVIKSAALAFKTQDNKDIIEVQSECADGDGDAVELDYEWRKNEEFAGTSSYLIGFKRGDKIEVTVTPSDGMDYGRPKVLKTEILNATPKIIGVTEVSSGDGPLVYKVEAEDPDGDTLTCSLKSAPEGMTIDPTTGVIRWNAPPDFKGRKSVSVIIADGNGGTVQYDLILTID